MKKRGLILNGYDTAAHGFTMTELSLQTPEIVEEYAQIDGMHGSLDYCEANGTVIYQTRPLEATFELSEGNFAEREETIAELIRLIHGKKCAIVHPDRGGKLLTGRVQVMREFHNLAHAKVKISATCQPWFSDPAPTYLELPILDRSHNLITQDNVELLSDLSSCEGGITGDTEKVTVTLFTSPADIRTYAVFRITLEADTTYYIGGSMYGKGYWRVSNQPTMPAEFDPIIKTGEEGYLYVFIVRLQSYGYLGLTNIVCVNSSEASILYNGSFAVPLEFEKPDSLASVLVVIGGVTKRHFLRIPPEFTVGAGDIPVVAFRYDTSDETLTEMIKFNRRWLE